MKKLTILLFSIFISVGSYGKWTEFYVDGDGDTSYIHTDTIKEHNGYVYYWELIDYLKPAVSGSMSFKTYHQGDCRVNRIKYLSYTFYKQPMGEGTGDYLTGFDGLYWTPPDKWKYPSPGSRDGALLQFVCDYVD